MIKAVSFKGQIGVTEISHTVSKTRDGKKINKDEVVDMYVKPVDSSVDKKLLEKVMTINPDSVESGDILYKNSSDHYPIIRAKLKNGLTITSTDSRLSISAVPEITDTKNGFDELTQQWDLFKYIAKKNGIDGDMETARSMLKSIVEAFKFNKIKK